MVVLLFEGQERREREGRTSWGRRAALYIDGFNLYHPIHERGEPFLKWANLWRLGEIFCGPLRLDLRKVVFCTAVPKDDEAKSRRHEAFNASQVAHGVTVVKGHHVRDDTGKRSEKQSDINLALTLMMDAEDDVFDWAFLLSADSDQAATGRVFSERHVPKRALIGVAPPSKVPPSKLVPYCIRNFTMGFEHLEECVMPAFVQGRSGKFIRRPEEYAPPDGWVHPDQRPK